ncbi:MAG: response regulator [Salibacteraceae bacterium]|nr:response regulator [Salibacteraceae bacterium]MDP4688050.1 response regulator [Salibacteraceae bacterium]MDP4763699.1 response regulator [Salibacteraceae bacterium]MDP4845292.1 response regulator [Salibacteraceae bacterium]MDP4933508.1 response regulator [Salibacteraceae bacterium]
MKKILLIEDNLDVRENTAEILELAGFDVSTAENGKRGVEQATSKDFDLIICDIMMPELDGYGVLNILNKNPRTSAVPFIFLTAKAEKMDFRKGMSMGADDYLTKPFEETDLLDTIELRLKRASKLAAPAATPSPEDIKRFLESAQSEVSIESLVTERNTKSYKKKDSIYREGEYPHALNYIVKGKVKLSKSSDYGKEFITQLCGPGEFLGYLALLENSAFNEEASAMEDSEIAFIPIEEFKKLINSNREVANNFIKILSKNVLEQEERLLKLAYGNVRERVATVLLSLYEKYGDNANGMINLAISREELAGYAGIATESLIRTLSDFKSEELIATEGKSMMVKNHDRLKRIASGGI